MAIIPENNIAPFLPPGPARRIVSVGPRDNYSIAEHLQADIVDAVLQYRADKLLHEELSRAWHATAEGEEKTVLYDMQRADEMEEGSLARIDLLAGRLAEVRNQ